MGSLPSLIKPVAWPFCHPACLARHAPPGHPRPTPPQTESNKSLRGFGNFMGMGGLAADLDVSRAAAAAAAAAAVCSLPCGCGWRLGLHCFGSL